MVGQDSELLLERDEELVRIGELLESARSGRGGVLVLEGPAGIGKTRLLRAAAALAEESGVTLLSARGSELERDFAYGVVRQLLERPLAEARNRQELLSGAAALAAPVLSHRATSAERQPSSVFGALHGLYWLSANLASVKPIALAIDDAHWADRPSLRFLAYLANRLEGLAVGVLVARRVGEPGSDLELFGEIATSPLVRLQRIEHLSELAVGELIRAAVAEEPHSEFVRACHEATGGNPLLVHELVASVHREQLAPTADLATRIEQIGSENVAHWILLRLRRLGLEAVEFARAIAVLGEDAELPHVAALADMDQRSAVEAANRLTSVKIVDAESPLSFVHPVVRGAVYQSLTSADRAHRHRQAAQLLAKRGAEPERVAGQLLPAEPAGESWAVEALHDAARAALERGAPEVAASYLRRALLERPSAERRPELVLELGLAEYQANEPEAVVHLEAALDCADDQSARARAAVALGLVLIGSAHGQRAVQVLDRAVRELDVVDPEGALAVEGSLLAVALMDVSTAPLVPERVKSLKARIQGGRAPRTVLAALAVHAGFVDEPASRVAELADRAFSPEARVDGPASELPFYFPACGALVMAERFDRARQLLDESVSEAQASGLAPQFSTALCFRSWLSLRRGDVADAAADASLSIEAGDFRSQRLVLPLSLAVLIAALTERGELAAAERELERSDLADGEHTSAYSALLLLSRGRLRLAQNRVREALDDALACGSLLEQLHAGTALASWRSDAALAYAALGDVHEAQRISADELELARSFGAPRALGVALRAVGLVKESTVGLKYLGEAAAVLKETQAKLEYARVLIDLGAALRRAGSRVESRGYLSEGMDVAYRCGALALSERARAELVVAGARPRRPVLSGRDALTASERRVARMAAEGLTNREIAQALFITTRTVEGHLTHVYRKLGIESRTELSGALE
jgi:DNA-binding CsgD family transcriptional regulator/tetratricopeptide (TPR) repeat protein